MSIMSLLGLGSEKKKLDLAAVTLIHQRLSDESPDAARLAAKTMHITAEVIGAEITYAEEGQNRIENLAGEIGANNNQILVSQTNTDERVAELEKEINILRSQHEGLKNSLNSVNDRIRSRQQDTQTVLNFFASVAPAIEAKKR